MSRVLNLLRKVGICVVKNLKQDYIARLHIHSKNYGLMQLPSYIIIIKVCY